MKTITEKDLSVNDIYESPNGNHFIRVSTTHSLAIGNINSIDATPLVKLNTITPVKKIATIVTVKEVKQILGTIKKLKNCKEIKSLSSFEMKYINDIEISLNQLI